MVSSLSLGSLSLARLSTTYRSVLQPVLTGIGILLLCISAWLAATITWRLITPADLPVPPAIGGQAATEQVQVNLNRIQQLHLFGERGAEASRQPRTTEAPETTLNIRLVGVTASTVPERSAAIIQQGNNQVTYIPGETISSSRAVINEILSDRVILENGGRLETLYLDGRDGFEPGITLRQVDQPQETREQPVERVHEVPIDIGTVNPENIGELVTITPVQREGNLIGYRLAPNRYPELFAAAGFESGDIAISLNGYDLTNLAEAASILRDVGSLTNATVVVLRNDEPITLELRIPNQ
ncbi:type II secretion system protein GspC [Aliidiomarina halalkaliphila]|uniref:Type II secretion system protein GspC n=1 Tax=Aliidiomarina halalkaliphila TaxID=2593535 RepID=A0A552X5L4_9GAMM|nr:type II secretion system protein GspC [Aliidiomarina halalkaliphila]TRW50317.1 type II secretion system protein GspC [Aliidiomarina halalkaliphila]